MFKRYLLSGLKFILSVGLIFLLFEQKDISIKGILIEIKQSNQWWNVLGIILFTTSTILGAIQWQMLLKARNIIIPLSRAVNFYYVGMFFNNFLPGYVAGDAFRIYDITKTSGNNSEAVSTVLLDRLAGFLVLTALALVSSLTWLYFRVESTSLFVFILLIFLGWLLILFVLFNNTLARILKNFFEYFLSEKMVTKLQEIYLSLNSFKTNRRLLIQVFLLSIVTQTLRVLTHFTSARALGINQIHPFYFFIFIPMVALAVTIPISIGGFGIREQTAVYLFGLPGVNGLPAQITSMEFVAYLIGVVCSLPGGIIFVVRQRYSKKPEEILSDLNKKKE